jgi:hypothetical protein
MTTSPRRPDYFAVTPNNPDGSPHENTAGYYSDAAMLAVYDPETRQRVGVPVASWPLIEGAHNHGDSSNPADPAAPPPEPEGRHAQKEGDGAHVHRGGRHAHDVVTPPWLRPLQVGDRVIVKRVAGSSWIVTHRPLPASVFLEASRAAPSYAVGWKE